MPINQRKKLSINTNDGISNNVNLERRYHTMQMQTVSSQPSLSKSKHVLIVGGSFAGLCAARHLSNHKDLDITVIEPRKVFEYVPGACHLLAGSKAYNELITPIEQCLPKKVKHVQGLFIGLKPNKLQALIKPIPLNEEDNNNKVVETFVSKNIVEIDYDAIIICTGRGYTTPIRSSEEGRTFDGRISEIEKKRELVHDANSILVIGGGLVGVELAADIASRSKKFLEKKQEIVLISRSQLLNTLPKKAGIYATKWFEKKNVSVSVFDEIFDTKNGVVTTKNGLECKPDVIFDCTGRDFSSSPKELKNITLLTTNSFVSPYDDKGFLIVDDFLQSSEYPNLQIFGAGDVIKHENGVAFAYDATDLDTYGVKSPMPFVRNAHLAESQAELVAQNVAKLLKIQHGDAISNTKLHRYPEDVFGVKLSPLLSCVSLGPRYGIVVFNNLVLGGVLLGILGSLVKFLIERSKIAEIRNKTWGRAFWAFGHVVSNFIHRTMCFFSKKSKKNISETPKQPLLSANI